MVLTVSLRLKAFLQGNRDTGKQDSIGCQRGTPGTDEGCVD